MIQDMTSHCLRECTLYRWIKSESCSSSDDDSSSREHPQDERRTRTYTVDSLALPSAKKTDSECSVRSLLDIAAYHTALHVSCDQIEQYRPPLDEAVLNRVAFWACPQDYYQLRAFADLTSWQDNDWHKGWTMFSKNNVKDMRQVGFMVSALLSPAGISVCFSFEKQHITSSSCDGCPGKVWCSHLIAAMIHRIVYADQIPIHAPLTESLSTLSRDKLQKLIQYAINEGPAASLRIIFRRFNDVRDINSEINMIEGGPDLTFGLGQDRKTTWEMTLDELKSSFRLACHNVREHYFAYSYNEETIKKSQLYCKYLQRVVDLVQADEVEAAGRVLIIYATVAANVTERVALEHYRQLLRSIERMCTLYILQFTGEARHDLIRACQAVNRALKHTRSRYSTFADLPLLSSLFPQQSPDVPGVLGGNQNSYFYEPLCASLVPSPPEDFHQLISGEEEPSDSSYDEALPLMMLRFEAIRLWGCREAEQQLLRLGVVILEKLLGMTYQLSIMSEHNRVVSEIKRKEEYIQNRKRAGNENQDFESTEPPTKKSRVKATRRNSMESESSSSPNRSSPVPSTSVAPDRSHSSSSDTGSHTDNDSSHSGAINSNTSSQSDSVSSQSEAINSSSSRDSRASSPSNNASSPRGVTNNATGSQTGSHSSQGDSINSSTGSHTGNHSSKGDSMNSSTGSHTGNLSSQGDSINSSTGSHTGNQGDSLSSRTGSHTGNHSSQGDSINSFTSRHTDSNTSSSSSSASSQRGDISEASIDIGSIETNMDDVNDDDDDDKLVEIGALMKKVESDVSFESEDFTITGDIEIVLDALCNRKHNRAMTGPIPKETLSYCLLHVCHCIYGIGKFQNLMKGDDKETLALATFRVMELTRFHTFPADDQYISLEEHSALSCLEAKTISSYREKYEEMLKNYYSSALHKLYMKMLCECNHAGRCFYEHRIPLLLIHFLVKNTLVQTFVPENRHQARCLCLYTMCHSSETMGIFNTLNVGPNRENIRDLKTHYSSIFSIFMHHIKGYPARESWLIQLLKQFQKIQEWRALDLLCKHLKIIGYFREIEEVKVELLKVFLKCIRLHNESKCSIPEPSTLEMMIHMSRALGSEFTNIVFIDWNEIVRFFSPHRVDMLVETIRVVLTSERILLSAKALDAMMKYFSEKCTHDVNGCKILTCVNESEINLDFFFGLIQENQINFTPSALLFIAQIVKKFQSGSAQIATGSIFSKEVWWLVEMALLSLEKNPEASPFSLGRYSGQFLPENKPNPQIQFVFETLKEKPASEVVQSKQFGRLLHLILQAFPNDFQTILSLCSTVADQQPLLDKCKRKFGGKITQLITEGAMQKIRNLKHSCYTAFKMDLSKVKEYFSLYVYSGDKAYKKLLKKIKHEHKTKMKLLVDL